MKIFKIVLIILGVLVLAGIIMGLTGPKNYLVERSAVISASPDVVWPYTSNGEAFQEWSPFRKMDTTATLEYFGNPGSVGSGFKWKGNSKVGRGEQTYTSLEPRKSANSHLKFYTPFGVMESDAYMNLDPDPAGTKLTWGVKGDNNFIGRIMGSISNMDKRMGPIFEDGLADLQQLITTRSAAMPAGPKIMLGDFPGAKYLGVRGDVSMSDIANFYGKNLALAMGAVQASAAQMAGMPTGLYYTWDQEIGMTNMMAAIPFQGELKAPTGTEIVTLEPSRAAMMDYLGGYSGLGNAHMAMENYFKANNLEQKAPVIEEYITDPGAEPDSNKWVTKIVYLVK